MCQLNNTLIYRSAAATTDVKKARLQQQLVLIVCDVLSLNYNKEIVCLKKIIKLFSLFVVLHFQMHLESGRAHYNALIQLAKAEADTHGVTNLNCTKVIQNAHYSFHYAQNVHIPSDLCSAVHSVS